MAVQLDWSYNHVVPGMMKLKLKGHALIWVNILLLICDYIAGVFLFDKIFLRDKKKSNKEGF